MSVVPNEQYRACDLDVELQEMKRSQSCGERDDEVSVASCWLPTNQGLHLCELKRAFQMRGLQVLLAENTN